MNETPQFEHLFVAAGAMKAGTTWLFQVMSQHPDLYFSFEKEIHYFYHAYSGDRVLDDRRRLENAHKKYLRFDPKLAHAPSLRQRVRWAANYLDGPVDDLWFKNLFAFRGRQKYCCEFSNLNALLDEAAWRKVSRSARHLRVLYTMRHPVKRLWSHVKFHLQVTNELEKLDQWSPTEFRNFAKQPFIWKNAEYGAALRAMEGGLAAETRMFLFFEDLHADQRGTLRRIEDFLNVDHFDYPQALLDRRVNEGVSRKMPAFFPDLFAKDIKRIISEVEKTGLAVPDSWHS
ncbi:sulfotransferase [Celeribacter litoreus]|uniref:sulfotransferase n=1 Tax=Celeribacter litoreus TaxID=2876714 RepID=UPI001CCEE004|nr:sulfotransferase [Celeribacter litoreus]MCA0042075.1 sulfotransferase [Celeribacter litoreus]